MGDMGDTWKAFRDSRRANRERLGIECPGCRKVQPKRTPTLLMPHMRCKVCGTTYHQAKNQAARPAATTTKETV